MRNKLIFKRIVALMAVLVLVLPLLACENADKKKKNADEVFGIYDLNEKQTSLVKEPYELKSEGAFDTKVNEMLTEMQGKSTDGSTLRPLPKDIEIQDYKFDSKTGILNISFSRSYNTMEPGKETLVRAAIVLTFMQFNEINGVTFSIEHEPLKMANNDGVSVGVMTDDSFIISLAGDDAKMQEATLMLFYPSQNNDGLYAEKRTVSYASNMSLERVVLRALAEKPEESEAKVCYPSSVSILNMYVADGTCYINMDDSFKDQITDEEMKLRVYSIVNSLTSLARINRVQLSCNGKNLQLGKNKDNKDILYSKDDSLTLNDIEGE